MESVAVPAVLALKLSVIILPLLPVYPGLNATPSNVAVPFILENDGSCAQRDIIEPLFDIELIETVSFENETVPDAPFIDWSVLETKTATENVSPAL